MIAERLVGSGWEVMIHWVGFPDPTLEKVSDLPNIAEEIREMRGHKVVEARAELARLQAEHEKRQDALNRTGAPVARQRDQLAGAFGKVAREGQPPRVVRAVARPRRH